MTYMVKTLKMFEFGSWEDATSRTSKMPTTTKWVDRSKKDGTTLEKHSSDADWWRAISNQSVKDQVTICSRRCQRWKRRKFCSRSLRGCVRRDERKDVTK